MPDAAGQFGSPTLLTEAHDAAFFESGESVLDDWLRQRALKNQHDAASRTNVVCPAGHLTTVGFAALSMGAVIGSGNPGLDAPEHAAIHPGRPAWLFDHFPARAGRGGGWAAPCSPM